MNSTKFSHNFMMKHVLEEWNFPYFLVIFHMDGITELITIFISMDLMTRINWRVLLFDLKVEPYINFNGGDKNNVFHVDVFRVSILQRFTPSYLGNLYEVLIGLQQNGSVD